MFSGEILQPQQIAFEITLIMKVNIETGKIGVLREQIFGRRICGIRKERIGIDRPADAESIARQIQSRDACRASAPSCSEISLPTR